jgi:tetratricopeptide (TPR) repeat protein
MTGSKDPGFVAIEPAAVELTAAATRQERKKARGGKRPMLWLGTGAALLVAAVVFFLLPRWVDKPVVEPGKVATRSDPDAPDPALPTGDAPGAPGSTAATGDAPWRKAQQFALRKESQEILQQLLDAQVSLEERGVTVWGRKEYEQALEQARSGDAEYSRQNFTRAHGHYARALEIFTELLQGVEELFSDTMETGNAALTAGDAATAEKAFGIALAIDPIDRTALLGMERVGTLGEVMDLVDRGDELLRDGSAEEAKALYQQALELDGHSERARQQLQFAESRISENAFNLAMSSGFRLLEQESYGQAQEAFSRALKLKPRSRDARSGVEQAQHRITAEKINGLLNQAETAEQNEDWQEAVSAYESALKLDDNLGNARKGKRRAALRSEIHNKIEQAITQPERLFDRDVYNQTAAFRDKIRALSKPGPVLSGQLAKLNRLLVLADTPVVVRFSSDNLTRVTLYKVGELGYFTGKSLSLRPGHYVAVGRRDGYRDVRVEFFVDPDKAMDPVIVSSTEKIALGR